MKMQRITIKLIITIEAPDSIKEIMETRIVEAPAAAATCLKASPRDTMVLTKYNLQVFYKTTNPQKLIY
jgi:hypothetical protein